MAKVTFREIIPGAKKTRNGVLVYPLEPGDKERVRQWVPCLIIGTNRIDRVNRSNLFGADRK